jgi:hypothetical protein
MIFLRARVIVKGCIKLCTEENAPFRMFNSEGLRMITEPLTNALGITINAAVFPEKIRNAAERIRENFSEELRHVLFSLKMDAATNSIVDFSE